LLAKEGDLANVAAETTAEAFAKHVQTKPPGCRAMTEAIVSSARSERCGCGRGSMPRACGTWPVA
jgi:hypothetical protein